MRRRTKTIFAIITLVVVSVFSFCENEVSATSIGKNIKTELTIQKGKKYKLDQVLKVRGLFLGKYSMIDIQQKLKKDKQCRLLGKGLTIRKNTFLAAKEGKYKLKVKLKKKTYTIPICAVNQTYRLPKSDIAKIEICLRTGAAEMSTVKVEEYGQLSYIVDTINAAKYSYDLDFSYPSRVGFGGYYLYFYDAMGNLITRIGLVPEGIKDDYLRYWTNKKVGAQVYEMIDKLYEENPKDIFQR